MESQDDTLLMVLCFLLLAISFASVGLYIVWEMVGRI